MLRHLGLGPNLLDERERAYSLAREHLLRARGHALFDLLSGLGDATSPSDVRVGLRAAALLRESVRLSPLSASSTAVLDYSTGSHSGEPA